MITLGTPEQFRALSEFLRQRYSEEIVCAGLGVASIRHFDERDPRQPIRDPLVRLMLGGAALTANELRPALPNRIAEILSELGLLTRAGDRIWCTVLLYPAWGLHLISDRFTAPDGGPFEPDREFVYFGLTANTLRYIESLPDRPCESFLDVGAGCGAAALVQARYAATAVAADISSRSTLFAEFNRRLNGITTMETVQGSLYEPVAGRMFDRIGCHPPYDASSSARWTFADGGADEGEGVIHGVIAGLADHLAPGGEFIAQFRAADRSGHPLEMRIRDWLGERNAEFDIAVIERETVLPQDLAMSAVLLDGASREDANARLHAMQESGAEQFAYCQVLIRRRALAGSPVTLRRKMGLRAGYDELRWLLEFGPARPPSDWQGLVLQPSAQMTLLVKHRAGADGLTPYEYRLMTESPFSIDTACPQWIPLLISECNGSRSGVELFARMREHGPIEEAQFTAALGYLISLGVLKPVSGSRISSSN